MEVIDRGNPCDWDRRSDWERHRSDIYQHWTGSEKDPDIIDAWKAP